jgi:CubicO group peptidase (beta-lactamase class C family)
MGRFCILRRSSVFLSSFVLFSVCTLQAQTLKTKIAQYMNAQASVNRFFGSILIAQKGKILVNRQYGLGVSANQGDELAQKSYRLGSIGKQFTATAILQLVDRGELRLKDSVCEYLPDCPSSWTGISISDLLAQTDAIPEVTDAKERGGIIGSQDLLRFLRGRALESKPGEGFRPSNSGYAVLGVVIENVSHEPYPKYLKDHIFDPVGMSHTGIDVMRKEASGHFASLRAIGSITPIDIVVTGPYNFGRVQSTTRDLYRWDRGLYTDQVISKKSADEMFVPHVDGYGFGWAIYWEFGRQVQLQNGGLNLVSSAIRRYPSDDACVIVLSNMSHVDAGRISRDLAAILFGKEYELPKKHNHIAINPSMFGAYVGSYELSQGLNVDVTSEDGHLMIQGAGQKKIELIPESETRFFVVGLDSEVTFVKGLNGRAAELILQQGGRDVPARRSDE